MKKIIKIKKYYTVINKKYWRGTPVKERFFYIEKEEILDELIRLKFNFEEEPYWNKYSHEHENILIAEEKDLNLAAKNILKRRRRKSNRNKKFILKSEKEGRKKGKGKVCLKVIDFFETKSRIFSFEDFLNNNLKNEIVDDYNYYCEYKCTINKGTLFDESWFEVSKNFNKEMFKASQIYNYLINKGCVFYE